MVRYEGSMFSMSFDWVINLLWEVDQVCWLSSGPFYLPARSYGAEHGYQFSGVDPTAASCHRHHCYQEHRRQILSWPMASICSGVTAKSRTTSDDYAAKRWVTQSWQPVPVSFILSNLSPLYARIALLILSKCVLASWRFCWYSLQEEVMEVGSC